MPIVIVRIYLFQIFSIEEEMVNASGQEIWQLAQKIQKEVYRSYGITIEAEVNVIK